MGRSVRTGLTLAVASAAAFGTSGAFAGSLLAAGWTPLAAVAGRIVLAALVLSPFAVAELRRRPLPLRALPSVAGYGLFAIAVAQVCYFSAVSTLPVGVALLLEYLGTLLVVGWMWGRHGQRPTLVTAAGGVVALLGLGLVLDIGGSLRLDPVGVLWGLGAAVGLAVYFVQSARGGDDVPPLVLAWGGMVVAAPLLVLVGVSGALPFAAADAPVRLAGRELPWFVPMLGMSLVAAAFAYVVGILGARHLQPRLASFVGLSEVLFAVLFAWVLLGQLPTAVQFVGGAVLLAGIALVRLGERVPDPGPELPAAGDAGGGGASVGVLAGAERPRG